LTNPLLGRFMIGHCDPTTQLGSVEGRVITIDLECVKLIGRRQRAAGRA
jgi:hypothetical protein